MGVKVTTYEATVENGQIKLLETVNLPEHARIYVVVPGAETSSPLRIVSPHFVDPGSAADFIKEVIEEPEDAGLR